MNDNACLELRKSEPTEAEREEARRLQSALMRATLSGIGELLKRDPLAGPQTLADVDLLLLRVQRSKFILRYGANKNLVVNGRGREARHA